MDCMQTWRALSPHSKVQVKNFRKKICVGEGQKILDFGGFFFKGVRDCLGKVKKVYNHSINYSNFL